jgi:phospholipid transport system substrate-binding protein
MNATRVCVSRSVVPLAACLGLSLFSAPTAVAGNGDPEAVIRGTIDAAFAVLKDRALAGRERRATRIAALRQVADRTFDWPEMARASLGVHWRSLGGPQRTRFVTVFKDVLAAEYMDDIDRFQGSETVTVDGSSREGEEVLVRTTLTTASRDRVPMSYRLRSQQGTWMVIDISIEGVSLVNHFRKTFSSALANMTIDELIARLERQLPRA